MEKSEEQKVFISDKVNLIELIKLFWENKKLLLNLTILFSIFSIFFVYTSPNIYKSEALLAPASNPERNRLSSQFGSVAALAGFNLNNNEVDKKELALKVLSSRKFISDFVQRHNIAPMLFAVEKWNETENKLYINKKIYNENKKQWVLDSKKPSEEEIYRAFKNILIVTEDISSDFVRQKMIACL